MAIISVGVEIIYRLPKDKMSKEMLENPLGYPNKLKHSYRAKSSTFKKMEDLLKYQIVIIAQEYDLENIISIRFTG